jgi:predicted ester cyclase
MATSSQGYGQAVPGDADTSPQVTQAATGGSVTDRSCAIARQFVEDGVNAHDLARIQTLLAPGFTITHNVHTPGTQGPEAFQEACSPFFQAFPDLHITITEMIGSGDRVASRYVVTGTNNGSWMGHPPTHRQVRYDAVNTMTVRDDRIVRMDILDDFYALSRQLGLLPAEEESRH